MEYDLAVIGAGWAGFNAVLRAKQLGLKACLIEQSDLGGTCLNRGCIPTKALIQSAKVYSLVKKSATFGINTENPRPEFVKIQERKEKIIQQLSQGIAFKLKGVDMLTGYAEIISSNEIKVGDKTLKVKYIIIATGSKPVELPFLKFDGKKIISSDQILGLKEIPQSLLIVGGGVIGCEFAGLFTALGTQVAIVEKMPQLLPGEDKEVARKLELAFKKKGVKVSTNSDASAFNPTDYDLALVCVGRMPATTGLEKSGVRLERGRVTVDEYLRTNISNIFAAGDCTGKIMLAHYAAYQGEVAAENCAHPDNPKKADNQNIPSCIFTDPEIASVGLNEEKAGQLGLKITINKFDFLASGMARILDEAEGFIKIISDQNTGELLGACIIGPKATELIAVFSLAVFSRLKLSQLKEVIFAHPTLSEAIGEAVK